MYTKRRTSLIASYWQWWNRTWGCNIDLQLQISMAPDDETLKLTVISNTETFFTNSLNRHLWLRLQVKSSPLGWSTHGLKTYMYSIYHSTGKNIIHKLITWFSFVNIMNFFVICRSIKCGYGSHNNVWHILTSAFSNASANFWASCCCIVQVKAYGSVVSMLRFFAVYNDLWWECKQLHQNKKQGFKVLKTKTHISIQIYIFFFLPD